jgi:HNH endonuclease
MLVRVTRGDDVDSEPFDLFENREDVFRKTRGRPNQQRFRIQVLQRYGGRCVLCDSGVSEWLHAAHLAGDAERGSSDPRNGLPFCSNHHAAFDGGLISLDPSDTRVYTRGYSAADLKITRPDLSHLAAQPAAEALQYRWSQRAPEAWSAAF